MVEEWKVYSETDNRRHGHIIWEVSNYGRVRKNGIDYEPFISNNYLRFGNQSTIHRAVAKLFISDIPKGYQVEHIDANNLNNRVDNLRICTPSENMNNPITIQRIKNTSKGCKCRNPWVLESRQKSRESHTGKKWILDIETKKHIYIK